MTKKTVLVVDDDPAVGELIQEILSLHPYQVLVAQDGLEAIEKSNHNHIDLILMDIRMKYFSGFWFCEAFHRRKNTCNIPVVMISGMMDEENAKRSYVSGAVDTIKKPFDPETLLKAVEKNAL